IRHVFEPLDLEWFDAFVYWIDGGVHPQAVCKYPEWDPLDRPAWSLAWARSCANSIREGNWMTAAAYAGEAVGCDGFDQGNRQGLDSDSAEARELAICAEFCHEFRDVAGNPFRPVALDPAWRTTSVLGLADAVNADRAFDRLPILADALEEAGCTNE